MAKNQNKTGKKPAMKLANAVLVFVHACARVRSKTATTITVSGIVRRIKTLNKHFKRMKNNNNDIKEIWQMLIGSFDFANKDVKLMKSMVVYATFATEKTNERNISINFCTHTQTLLHLQADKSFAYLSALLSLS